MPNALSARSLMVHIRALADEIGPRPAGHPAEGEARSYIRDVLTELGYTDVESLAFRTPDTWGYALGMPVGLAILSNLLGNRGRAQRLMGGLATLGAAYLLWEAMRVNRQPLTAPAPRRLSATLLVRIPAVEAARHRVVLLAHTDTNKARLTFHPRLRRGLLALTTTAWANVTLNGMAQIVEALTAHPTARQIRRFSGPLLAASLGILLADERGDYIPGASDNASAVAVLLGLAAHLAAHPLRHTDVWLAFTGAEEVGGLGTHALLDTYGDKLRDAWFLDLEMVGTHEVVFVTRHTGFAYVTAYTPDADSLAWAETTARRHPEYGVRGRELVIGEEVGALRARGYRGLCLAGVGPDGWLAHWHRPTDDTAHIIPAGLELAANFTWAMLRTLDENTLR